MSDHEPYIDPIRESYISQGVTPKAYGELHMFFSPYFVPVGLTLRQCQICCDLSYLRQEYASFWQDNSFEVTEPMTEETFKEGIKSFLADLTKQICAWDFAKEPTEEDKAAKAFIVGGLTPNQAKAAVRSMQKEINALTNSGKSNSI